MRDAAGDVVRRLTGPTGSGFHRVAWDLRYPDLSPFQPEQMGEEDDDDGGFLAAPGTYTVSLAKRVDGVVTDLGKSQSFEVVPMRSRGYPGAEPAAVAAFLREFAQLQGVVQATHTLFHDTEEKIGAIKGALMRSMVPDSALDDEVREIESRVVGLHDILAGNDRRDDEYADPGPVTVMRRLGVVSMGNFMSTYGPTPMHRRQLEIAREEFAELRDAFDRILSEEIPALEQRLDAAGVPWSPGRGLPGSSR